MTQLLPLGPATKGSTIFPILLGLGTKLSAQDHWGHLPKPQQVGRYLNAGKSFRKQTVEKNNTYSF
jgi:hypothetical protein